jgi:hypothetical protein
MIRAIAEEIVGGLIFLGQLPSFLASPISFDRARATLSERLNRRSERFLDLMRGALYASPQHPYLRLIREAGCEMGDIEKMVKRDGLENTLLVLSKNGIYLTAEEFKGRRPIVRGNLRLSVHPNLFLNAAFSSRLLASTSGGSGPRTRVPITLNYVRSRSVDAILNLKICRGISWQHGVWAVPGSSALVYILELAGCGLRPMRWFSQVDPASRGLHPRYLWSSRAIRWASLAAGLPLPKLSHVSLDDPGPILNWMRQALRIGAVPHLFTYTSSAVRLSQSAGQKGISLGGAQITVTGEPVTRTRLAAIEDSGARVYTRYGTAESGTIGYGCLARDHPDEVHFLSDRLALIAREKGTAGEGFSEKPLLVTTLDPGGPFFLLNVSLGDQGAIAQRNCGCPLEKLGWKTHVHSISSFEKLTSQGMTFLRRDVSRVVDEVLPQLFGGGPSRYQLMESEDREGRPCLLLLVHPCVGCVDSNAIVAALIEALSVGNGVENVMGRLWRDARFIRVERRPPIPTASGKILPLLALSKEALNNSHASSSKHAPTQP